MWIKSRKRFSFKGKEGRAKTRPLFYSLIISSVSYLKPIERNKHRGDQQEETQDNQ